MSKLAKAFGSARSLLAKDLTWEEAVKPLLHLFKGLTQVEAAALQEYLKPQMIKWPDRKHTVRPPQNLPKGWVDLNAKDLLGLMQEENLKHDPLLPLVNNYVCTSEEAMIYLSRFIPEPARLTWRLSQIESPSKVFAGFCKIPHMTFLSKTYTRWGFLGKHDLLLKEHFLDLSPIQMICIQEHPLLQPYLYNAPSWSKIKAWDLTNGLGHIPLVMASGGNLRATLQELCQNMEQVHLTYDLTFRWAKVLIETSPNLDIVTCA